MVIPPGQTNNIFAFSYRAGAPIMLVTAPDGATYSPLARRKDMFTYATTDPKRLPTGIAGAQALELVHARGPASGTSPSATCTAARATASPSTATYPPPS